MTQSQTPVANPPLPPHNRLGLDYHQPPPRRLAIPGGIVDAHNHTRDIPFTRLMVQAAATYGVTQFWTQAPLEFVPAIKEAFPGQFHFIAIPNWKRDMPKPDEAFFADWKRRLEQFAALGAKFIKFHAAPRTCKHWGITLDDPRIRDIAQHAYTLGFHFMTHVGDPKAWFYEKGPYADGTYGTFDSQFPMLDRLLETYPDRLHLGADMGGSLEALDALARRLEKFPHYIIDMSATKWIVRAVAEQSQQAVRDFIITFQDRIIFGTDLVVDGKFDWEHYASRYWTLQMLWESSARGESPIEDPDAGQGFDPRTNTFDPARATAKPLLAGVNLPDDVLVKIYRTNADRLWPK